MSPLPLELTSSVPLKGTPQGVFCSSKMAFGVALVGAGIFAKGVHAPALKALSSHYVVRAVWSRSESSAAGGMELLLHAQTGVMLGCIAMFNGV